MALGSIQRTNDGPRDQIVVAMHARQAPYPESVSIYTSLTTWNINISDQKKRLEMQWWMSIWRRKEPPNWSCFQRVGGCKQHLLSIILLVKV